MSRVLEQELLYCIALLQPGQGGSQVSLLRKRLAQGLQALSHTQGFVADVIAPEAQSALKFLLGFLQVLLLPEDQACGEVAVSLRLLFI